MNRKQKVADTFAAAAATYEDAAEAQMRAARHLAGLVTALALPAHPDVVEIGCGTGLLTRILKPAIGGSWLLTDLSPAMVAAAAAAIPDSEHRVMDGEHPDIAPASVDLIVSNLAAQWFTDLPEAIERLAACLRPGGALAFSTLAYGSLREWQAAHARLGLADGIGPFPSFDALQMMLPRCRLYPQTFTVNHVDGRAFLAALKAIGATVAAEGHRPLSPGSLRKVIKEMGAPAEVSYHVVHAVLLRE